MTFLEGFAGHLATTRTGKSYKNDISYLRIFLGPICDALKPGGTRNTRFGKAEGSVVKDRFAGRHVEVKTLVENARVKSGCSVLITSGAAKGKPCGKSASPPASTSPCHLQDWRVKNVPFGEHVELNQIAATFLSVSNLLSVPYFG